jgi:5-methylcytosine-specific restriction endonuclease McrA
MGCCGKKHEPTPERWKRESEPLELRRRPGEADKRRILDEQGHLCFYCFQPFGYFVRRPGKARSCRLRQEWDHAVPYSYSQNNNATNFVAACHVCNGLKSDYVFATPDEARVRLDDLRRQAGYDF